MPTLFIFALLCAPVPFAVAAGLDPEQAAREAKDDLDSLLTKQREDRAAPAQRREPEPRPSAQPPAATGTDRRNDLPAICVGCGAQ